MAERGFLEHAAPDGASMVERLKHGGVRYVAAAEDLARVEGRDPRTGVGACRKGRAVCMTQLFIRPP